jgi:hypothetical protein
VKGNRVDTDKIMASAQNAVAKWLYNHSPQIIRDWLDRREERAMATEQSEQHLNRHGLKEMADRLGLPPVELEVMDPPRREGVSLQDAYPHEVAQFTELEKYKDLVSGNQWMAVELPIPGGADRSTLDMALNAAIESKVEAMSGVGDHYRLAQTEAENKLRKSGND